MTWASWRYPAEGAQRCSGQISSFGDTPGVCPWRGALAAPVWISGTSIKQGEASPGAGGSCCCGHISPSVLLPQWRFCYLEPKPAHSCLLRNLLDLKLLPPVCSGTSWTPRLLPPVCSGTSGNPKLLPPVCSGTFGSPKLLIPVCSGTSWSPEFLPPVCSGTS